MTACFCFLLFVVIKTIRYKLFHFFILKLSGNVVWLKNNHIIAVFACMFILCSDQCVAGRLCRVVKCL